MGKRLEEYIDYILHYTESSFFYSYAATTSNFALCVIILEMILDILFT